MRLLGCLCQKSCIPDYLFCDLNEISMRDESFDDLMNLRRDIGSLIRNLCKCCGAKPVITYTNQRISESYAKLHGATGDQYI